jgi:hypothetical protein
MGERDFRARYKDVKHEADSAARAFAKGDEVKGWHHEPAWVTGPATPIVYLTGAPWVAWLYEIAKRNAIKLVQVHGKQWQYTIDECERLMQEYQQKAKAGNG